MRVSSAYNISFILSLSQILLYNAQLRGEARNTDVAA